jgi:hypothetical protein
MALGTSSNRLNGPNETEMSVSLFQKSSGTIVYRRSTDSSVEGTSEYCNSPSA